MQSTPQMWISFFEQPRHHVGMRAGMTVDVLLLVRARSELAVLVPAGVEEQQIAVLHLDAVFDHLRRVEAEFVHLVGQIDDHARTAQPLDRNLVDRHALRDEVARRIEVRAHVVRRLDVLRVDAVLGLALDVLHLERRVVRPELHCSLSGCDRS